METTSLVALISLVIAVIAVLMTALGLRQKVGVDTVEELRAELHDCERRSERQEKQITSLRADVSHLKDDNFKLMERLLHLENRR